MKTQNEHWRKKSYQKATLETKLLVVDQILNGQISRSTASKKYDVPRTTISYWLRKYSTLVQQNIGMSKNDEIKKLKEKIEDPDYSIVNIPVTDKDVKVMNEAIQVLRQFKDFSLFKEMDGVLQRLEDSVYASQKNNRAIFHLDKNEQLKGLEFIDVIYEAIQNKKVVEVTYQSFNARKSSTMKVHPQLLKEFNNRWFVLATNKGKFITLALDRIIKIEIINGLEYFDLEVIGDEYYKEVIGVTVSNSRAQRIQFWIDKKNAPYVITKPFHASQRTIETREDGTIFNILVQVNFELERLILGFGDSIEVLKPLKLRERMQKKLRTAIRNYAPKEI